MITLGVKINGKLVPKIYYEILEDRIIKTYPDSDEVIKLTSEIFKWEINCKLPLTIYHIALDLKQSALILNNDMVISGNLSEIFEVLGDMIKHIPYKDINQYKPFNELTEEEKTLVLSDMNVEEDEDFILDRQVYKITDTDIEYCGMTTYKLIKYG